MVIRSRIAGWLRRVADRVEPKQHWVGGSVFIGTIEDEGEMHMVGNGAAYFADGVITIVKPDPPREPRDFG